MALLDLLTNPSAFPIGRKGHSKNITYASNESPFHLKRVEWDITDSNANPTFLVGEDHSKSGNIPDYMFRGGFDVNLDRRMIDSKRISKFLSSEPNGRDFILRQTALQMLNPQNKLFNLGVSLTSQIALSGLSNVKRSGFTPFSKNDTYTEINKKRLREDKYGLGSPGKGKGGLSDILGDLNPFKKSNTEYNISRGDSREKIDFVNYQSLYKVWEGIIVNKTKEAQGGERKLEEIEGLKDFIDFRFEVMDSDMPLESTHIVFRAFLDQFTDNLTANHNEIKYNGRGEKFYTYESFDRKINISFKIAAQTRHEMQPLYQKLNYLMAQTAPNYSTTGRIRTPYMKLTMGDYFNKLPGVLKTCNVSWTTDYPWEIKLDPLGADKDMKVLPHVLDVSISFQPIHKFIPNNSERAPFISIDSQDTRDPDWLPRMTEEMNITLETKELTSINSSVEDQSIPLVRRDNIPVASQDGNITDTSDLDGLLDDLSPSELSEVQSQFPDVDLSQYSNTSQETTNFDFMGSLPQGEGPIGTEGDGYYSKTFGSFSF